MEYYSINPEFNSRLMSTLFDLEPLRYELMSGTTPPWLFYDLKEILYLIESIASARIEGNHTTLVDAASKLVGDRSETEDDSFREIINIRTAIAYVEENFSKGSRITLNDIREIQAIVTDGLVRDGSATSGAFRTGDVMISNSNCVVTPPAAIETEMQELVNYINTENEARLDVIKIACAHHRFVAIHPFDNGNGRTARVLTYLMLIKYGFLRNGKAILNPSSIFCMDRQEYYQRLAGADTLSPSELESWCLYVATGILREARAVHNLLDKDYTVSNIIMPALRSAKEDKFISELEYEIMKIAINKDIIQASDVKHLFGTTNSDATKCSRFLSSMINKRLLMHPPKYPKKYVARFFCQDLLPGILRAMDINGFLSTEEKGGNATTIDEAAHAVD